jgi:predicted flap endonuclease-1-like 5' DNA nuclease
MQLFIRQMEHREEQLAVAELVDEFCRTGVLQEHLPREVDIVHRVVQVYAEEKRWNHQREQRLASQRTVVHVEPAERSSADGDELPATIPFAPRQTIPQSRSPGSLAHAVALTEAPSIGPRTAARLAAIGIHTISQFLAASAEQMASQLGAYWITGDTVSQWQAQVTLMCDVPGLKCREAQLLSGAQYDTAEKVAGCDPTALHREVSEFAATARGRRYLCGAAPPSLGEVKRWIEDAATTQLPVRRRA